MTSLTEARKALMVLRTTWASGRLDDSNKSENAAFDIGEYLESQVAESVEVADLRARLARSEAFMNAIKNTVAIHTEFSPQTGKGAPWMMNAPIAPPMPPSPPKAKLPPLPVALWDANTPPIPSGYEMTARANGRTYGEFFKAGWTTFLMVDEGYMTQVSPPSRPEILQKLLDFTGRPSFPNGICPPPKTRPEPTPPCPNATGWPCTCVDCLGK